MSVNGEHDIEGLKRIGAVVAAARDAMATHVVPGVTTAELDASEKSIWTGTAPGQLRSSRMDSQASPASASMMSSRMASPRRNACCARAISSTLMFQLSSMATGLTLALAFRSAQSLRRRARYCGRHVLRLKTACRRHVRAHPCATLAVRSNAGRSLVASGSFATSADMALDATSMKILRSQIRFTHGTEPYCEKASSSRSSRF